MGHTMSRVKSICWSTDGGRVLSGCQDGTFIVCDVTESEEIILGPIKARDILHAVCYSPDGNIIATGGDDLRIWDADTG
jgi:WD40 repeat protein